jgi:DNA-directed RNA polymerase subunit F
MNVRGTKPVTVAEARELLSERKEIGELGYEQSQALEHAEKFTRFDTAKAKKAVSAIMKAGKVSESIAVKIVDICPENAATLKAILTKDKVELSEEEMNDIIKELS